ncbi:kinase-like domain-containing protein [Coprinopsis sp. MPI-PUGE-AT-0042]|nr:kinase-like domain-containing protein [Coprinopsis sp. MPI-PUGE-AT-0042]
MSKFASAGTHPPPGTLIDNDSLELVELVGSGGYGVVYRAVETTAKPGRKRRTFAVKVLSRTDGRRNTHIREASLHYHVSGHPNIIDLYQVLEDDNLFDHLHKMGVYHRDLKPENILCLDDGYRIAVSDFGLATTETSSVEFRTGSVYHMSPECQSGRFAEDAYSPMSNDVWSLATVDDPVFQSYRHSPFNSSVLIQVLDPNWKTRMSLQRFRKEVEKIKTFYSPKVIFEGSLARCPWGLMRPPKQPRCTSPRPETADRAAASPSPRPASPPATRPVASPQRRPVPAVTENKDPDPSVDPLDEKMARSAHRHRQRILIPHFYPSRRRPPQPSFPKTPEEGGFMRRKNKIDVKIMASTHVSPSSSFVGDTCSPPSSTGDFSNYLDMSFSNDLFKPAADETMLSPAPSQYSLHEASEYSMWTEAGKDMPYPIGNDPRTAYPELQPPAASKPIDIVGAPPRVTGVRKLWSRDKKLPPRPVPTYTGRPYCGPHIYHHQAGGKWFEGKV